MHEAGHIVLAHLFPQFDWHAFSQLLPGGKVQLVAVARESVDATKSLLKDVFLNGSPF